MGIAWSDYRLYTLRYIVYLLLGISVIFVFSTWVTTIERYKYIFAIIKNVVFIEFVVSILEILRIFRWPNSPYSQYAPLFRRGAKDFSMYADDVILRIMSSPTGFTGNPNDLAIFVVMVLPFCLFSRKFYVPIFGAILSLIIIISASSRGVFIAFTIGMTVYFCMKYKKLFLIIATVILFLITGLTYPILDILKKSENAKISEITSSFGVLATYLTGKSTQGNSISIRQQLIGNGLIELKISKGLGVGGGASIAIQQVKYGLGVTSMHNFWVEILVEGGIIGFLLFLAWYLSLMYKLLTISKKTKNDFIKYISSSLFLSMTFFSVGCISASSVIYNLTMWLMFGMAISIIYINKNILDCKRKLL
ncbi:hypothetical protein AGMMS49579_17940 [Spirochaetia bacterium]|nr:hypothetical protein AGMMS49579_17940 [Spirochaetia bacterium]